MARWIGDLHFPVGSELSLVTFIFLEEDDKDSNDRHNSTLDLHCVKHCVLPGSESPIILFLVPLHCVDLRGLVPEFLYRDEQPNRRRKSEGWKLKQ